MTKKKNNRQKHQKDVTFGDTSEEELNDVSIQGKHCPHVARGIHFGRVKKSLKTTQSILTCNGCLNDQNTEEEQPEVWLCLQCGYRGCGRMSENKHGLQHYKTIHSDCHSLVLSTTSGSVWCYDCDDEVRQQSSHVLKQCVDFVLKSQPSHTLKHCAQLFETTPNATSNPDFESLNKGAVHQNLQNSVIKEEPTVQKSEDSPPEKMKKQVKSNKELSSQKVQIKGLRNLGNTCFFNAVMQNLTQTSLLFHELKITCNPHISWEVPELTIKNNEVTENSDTLKLSMPRQFSLTNSLLNFFEQMNAVSSAKVDIVNPSPLFGEISKKCPQFRHFQQQDSHELLRQLLDGVRQEEIRRQKKAILKYFELEYVCPEDVDEEMKKKFKAYGCYASHTVIEKVFGGLLISTVLCEECKGSSQVFEPFMDLSLPLFEEKQQENSEQLYGMLDGGKQDHIKPMRNRKSDLEFDENTPGEYVLTKSKVESGKPSKHQEKKQKQLARKEKKKMAKNARNRKTSLSEQNENSNVQPSEAVDENDDLEVSKDSDDLEVSKDSDDLEVNKGSDEEQIIEDNLNEDDFESSEKPEEEMFVERNEIIALVAKSEDQYKYDESDMIEFEEDGNAEKAELDRLETEKENKMEYEESDMTESGCKDINGNFTNISLIDESQPDIQLVHNQDTVLTPQKEMHLNSSENSITDVQVESVSSARELDEKSMKDNGYETNDRKDESLKSLDMNEISENVEVMINGDENSFACLQPEQEDNEYFDVSKENETNQNEKSLELAVVEYIAMPKNFVQDKAVLNCNAETGEIENEMLKQDDSIENSVVDFENSSTVSELNQSNLENRIQALSMQVKGLRIRRDSDRQENILNSSESTDDFESQQTNCTSPKSSIEDTCSNESGDNWSHSVSEQQTKEWILKSLTTLTPRPHVSALECSINSCLSHFTKPELLTGNNKFRCENCTEEKIKKTGNKKDVAYTNASKQMLVFSPPAVLTLHLKRFQQVSMSLRKVNRFVEFPLILDLAPFCSSACVILPHMASVEDEILYSLYGIVEHSGRLTSGHYTAYVKASKKTINRTFECQVPLSQCNLEQLLHKFSGKNHASPSSDSERTYEEDRQWFYISDTHVKEVSEAQVLRCQAYLLFYERIK